MAGKADLVRGGCRALRRVSNVLGGGRIGVLLSRPVARFTRAPFPTAPFVRFYGVMWVVNKLLRHILVACGADVGARIPRR